MLGISGRLGGQERKPRDVSRREKISVPNPSDASRELPSEDLNFQINVRLHLGEIVDIEAAELQRQRPLAPSRKQLCQLACRIYDARRGRDRFLSRKLLGEPGWDMLLALYCLPARGELLTVSSASLAADAAVATGIRWQRILLKEKLIERGPSYDSDGRRIHVKLTKQGRDLLEAYLTRLYYCDTPAPPHPDVHDD